MNKKQFIKSMKKFKDISKAYDKCIDDSSKYVNFEWLIDISSSYNDFFIKTISELSGITEDAISWFIYENNFGENRYSCSKNKGRMVTISSSSKFWDFEKS